MPKRKNVEENSVADVLREIHYALQDLFILQAKIGGLKKAQVRTMLGVGDARVTRIWREFGEDT
jgi:hypothetical protein